MTKKKVRELWNYAIAHVPRLPRRLALATSVLRTAYFDSSNVGQRWFRVGCALLWQLYKSVFSFPIVIRLANGYNFLADPRSGNATGAIYTRTYEARYIEFVRKNIVSLESSLMVDVGAHTGLFALWIADRVKYGLLFEPASDTVELAKANIGLNGLQERFSICRLAASSANQKVSMRIDGSFSGTNAVSAVHPSADDKKEYIEIEAVKVDDYIKCTRFEDYNLTFIKVDCEGHDLDVLIGARGLLQRSQQAIAVVENSNSKEIRLLFRNIGWHVFALNVDGDILVDEESLLGCYNLVAVGGDHPISKRL